MSQTYSNFARFLHWLVAGLIVSQYVLAEIGENARDADNRLHQLAVLANHKSIGMTILILAIVRLLYRWKNPVPPLPATMPNWQKRASHAGHFALYFCLFALPISGWLMSSANAYSVSWFNLFSFPNLIQPDKSLVDTLKDVHEFLGEALIVLAIVHIGAALKHHFIDKDSVLTRMANKTSWLLLIATIGVSIFLTAGAPKQREAAPAVASSSTAKEAETVAEQPKQSSLPAWEIDYANSFIKFTGEQAGAEFTGRWQQWTADIRFTNANLSAASFDVTIQTDSGFTDDQERDETIRSEEFFDVSQFAEARYQADSFSQSDDGYIAKGKLSMKGVSQPVELRFQVEQEEGRQVLTGQAKLNRLAWNIGTGEWSNTDWVGKDVDVAVKVVTQ